MSNIFQWYSQSFVAQLQFTISSTYNIIVYPITKTNKIYASFFIFVMDLASESLEVIKVLE